ncbi:uncharacterized protein TNCV_3781431 [Trichonephila clavipes]|nr:uncharacterized protein TNCV_3781431 [Trichonephila clavipes]
MEMPPYTNTTPPPNLTLSCTNAGLFLLSHAQLPTPCGRDDVLMLVKHIPAVGEHTDLHHGAGFGQSELKPWYRAKLLLEKNSVHISSSHITSTNQSAAAAEWYRYRTVACFVTGSSPVPLKTRRVGQRCTLNLSRAETSSRWCGVVVRRGGASSGVVHVT